MRENGKWLKQGKYLQAKLFRDLYIGRKIVQILRSDFRAIDSKSVIDTREEKELFEVSREYGVAIELWKKLKEANIHSEIFEFFYEINRRKTQRYLEFLEVLKGVGEFTLLKGMSFAQKYYGDAAGRTMSDIDILIKHEDEKKFVKFFENLGFSKLRQSEIRKKFEHVKQFGGEFKGEMISVGLHLYATNLLFAKIRYEDTEKEETEIKLGRKSVKVITLSPEWDLIHAGIHLFPHAFALKIFLDIHKILSSQKISMDKVIYISEKFGVKDAVLLGILGAEKIFGEPKIQENQITKVGEKTKEKIPSYKKILLDFITKCEFQFLTRRFLTSIPYLDTSFSLLVFGKIPMGLILKIMPLIPTEFIRRIKGEYIVSR